ncbi:DUF1992 domain-containing protein [Nocardioidaceae bacterium]|nr:DUF1992 domain-containing protein [Nocardioidaceae bacterium]
MGCSPNGPARGDGRHTGGDGLGGEVDVPQDTSDGAEGADGPRRLRGEGGSERAERVRSARTAQHRRWADLQVDEAMRRGDFDGLRGAGRPLDLGQGRDRDWWLRRLVERERIEGPTHPALALRLDDARLDDALDAEGSAREVRHRVEEFNARIREARRQLTGGPPVITPLRDVEVEVRRWRERAEHRREAQRRARATEPPPPARRRRLGIFARRRAGGRDEDGAARAYTVGAVATVVLVAVAALVVGMLVVRGPAGSAATAPSASSAPATSPAPADTGVRPVDGERLSADRCSTATQGFRPTSVSIPGIAADAEVVHPARDGSGVPGTPPLTADGKAQMAFDVENGIAPGAAAGNALFNAHTWPDGSALGNRLLEGLRVGDRFEVRGTQGRVLCYRLTRRVQVPATVSGAQYYRRDGAPRMAIVVCSGTRTGPGQWSHRTLFFAAPVP